jgi:microcystin-dependent protein
MAQPYVGEIRMFAGNFAPAGWFFCEGQLLPISEYETLFNLIGTTYGGDGQSTFALPDLRGRLPIHQGSSHVLGEMAGVEGVTLTNSQIPSHTHGLMASTSPGVTGTPAGQVLAVGHERAYTDNVSAVTLATGIVSAAGGSQPHTNFMPYLCVNFIISMFGIFPSPT